MTIANTVASKLFVGVVAIAMAVSAFAPSAKAMTEDELKAEIAKFQQMLAALSGTTGGSMMSSTACPYTWTTTLKTGSTGAAVKQLQMFLNSSEDTRVAAAGMVGSAGMETETYGPATAAAVSKFQTKYRSDILTPAGLVNPTGTFGPATMAKANALCVSAPAPVDPGTDDDSTTDDDSSTDDEEDVELSGEASLTTFEIADGDDADEAEENSEDVIVGEITVEFEDGDAEISRLDLALEVDSGNNGDDDPWDVFQEISLWVDGDEVARMDISDEDQYLDEDDGSIRFSDLSIVAMEDEEVVIDVAVTINSAVDGVTSSDDEDWNLAAGSLRFFDADGVATTETTFGDLQDLTGTLASPIAEFAIEAAGAGDELELEESDESPEADTLGLEDDSNTEHLIFAFDLVADDSDGDIVVNDISIRATSTVASNLDDLVNDFRIEIGSDSYDAESYVGTAATATILFDVDGDTVITAGDTVTVKVYADFEDMESADEGSTIIAEVSGADVDVEGDASGEVIAVTGSIQGEVMTLRTSGVSVALVDETVTAIENNDTTNTDDAALFEVEFTVSAFGDSIYLPFGATASTTDLSKGVVYSIINTNTNTVVTTGTTTPSLDMGDDAETNSFKVSDGSSETFTVTVEFDPTASGSYKVRIDEINYALSDVGTATASQDVSSEDIDTAPITIQQ